MAGLALEEPQEHLTNRHDEDYTPRLYTWRISTVDSSRSAQGPAKRCRYVGPDEPLGVGEARHDDRSGDRRRNPRHRPDQGLRGRQMANSPSRSSGSAAATSSRCQPSSLSLGRSPSPECVLVCRPLTAGRSDVRRRTHSPANPHGRVAVCHVGHCSSYAVYGLVGLHFAGVVGA
jgi:hypothetical protein